jgi:hypothetical protein
MPDMKVAIEILWDPQNERRGILNIPVNFELGKRKSLPSDEKILP